jgi:hypothetical protein
MDLSHAIRLLSVSLTLGVGQAAAWSATSEVTPWIGTRVDPALIPPGEIIVVEAMLRDDAPSLEGLNLRAIIIDPSGIERMIELPPTDVDHFAASFQTTDEVGEHRVQVIAVGNLADGSRVEISPQATVFAVDEDAPMIPQLPPEASAVLAVAPDTELQPEISQGAQATEEATADEPRVMGYPPWAPPALGAVALLLLVGGAAVLRRRRKGSAPVAATESPSPEAVPEVSAEAASTEAPEGQEKESIASPDPEPIEKPEKGEEAPSEADESNAAEDSPDEEEVLDLKALEQMEELMGLLSEEQLAALWKFAMEESGYGDRIPWSRWRS